MKEIYRMTKTCFPGGGAEKLALLLHTLLRFLSVSFVTSFLLLAAGLNWDRAAACAVPAGSFASLLGYIGGILWLVNREE